MMIETIATNIAVLTPAIIFFIGGIKSVHLQRVDANLVVGLIGITAIIVFEYFHPGLIRSLLGVDRGATAITSETSGGMVATTVVLVALFLSFLLRKNHV